MHFPTPQRVVVIGGGVAGASIARVLARRGVGVTVLEKASMLCAGATWHAAGLVTRFGGSPKIKKVHVHALNLMTKMHEEHDIGLHLTGSIRIINKGDTDRLLEAKQHLAMAALYDDPAYPTSLISPSEIASLHPLVNVENVECGLFTPHDGDIDPTLLTTCIAKLAKADGALFRFNQEVASVAALGSGAGPRFAVTTAAGETLEADAVVNAAGLWSCKFSNQLGMNHPAVVIEHQYVVTETIPGLAGKVGNAERVPVLRDLAGSSYIRQERDGLLVGPYEFGAPAHDEWPEGPPANFAFDLFPPALDRLENCLLQAMELVPSLGEVGFKSVVNGPTIWTGDSLARCGRTRLPGYYDFNSLTYGVAQSLALSEYLGCIMLEGEQPYDMATEFDPLRYSGAWAGMAFTVDKVHETYSHNNHVSYPFENRPGGRQHVAHAAPLRALFDAFAARGALFGFSNAGVEVPLAYPTAAIAAEAQKTFHSLPWAEAAQREAQALLSGVGIGYASFSKLRVASGVSSAATQLLERATTNILPKAVGACRLTYATTRAGRVLAEFTITREGSHGADKAALAASTVDHDFYLVGPRDYAQHDLAWLEGVRDALSAEHGADFGAEALELADITSAVEILHLAGPLSHSLVSELCPAAAEVPFLRSSCLDVLGVPCRVFCISFTGELGYELHAPAAEAATLYEAIWRHPAAAAHGLVPFGGHAVNSLRIEKGFKVKSDLDYTHWTEAGIEPFVKLKRKASHPFVGRDAPAPSHPHARRAAIFDVAAPDEYAWSVPGDCPIRNSAGELVGVTTTSARGAVTGRTIAHGFVMLDESGALRASPGEVGLFVECYGHQWQVRVLDKPPVSLGHATSTDPQQQPERAFG